MQKWPFDLLMGHAIIATHVTLTNQSIEALNRYVSGNASISNHEPPCLGDNIARHLRFFSPEDAVKWVLVRKFPSTYFNILTRFGDRVSSLITFL